MDKLSIIFVAVLCICFFGLGYLVTERFFVPVIKQPQTVITIQHDTIRVKAVQYIKQPFKVIQTDTLLILNSNSSHLALVDSLQGLRDSISYKVVHSIQPGPDSSKSLWQIAITSLKKITTNTIQIEVPKYLDKPVFMEKSFWIAAGSVLLLILAIIF